MLKLRFAGILVAALLSLTLASVLRAQDSQGPALGSPDYRPSPEHPIGWRGDWTGRFPAARPPTQWSRRVKGITTELKYQAKKPVDAGAPGGDAKSLEYFTIKDWLVAGPFEAADPKADIEKDFLGDEATVEPDEGQKAGGAAWKALHIGMENQSMHVHNDGIIHNLNVDFVYVFGKFTEVKDPKKDWEGTQTKIEGDFDNKVAYGHTYIYSPAAGPANLEVPYVGAALHVWFNGKPVQLAQSWNEGPHGPIALAQGWNRLLVKVSCAKGLRNTVLSTWRFAAYITPAGPVAYETKNIAWMTRVTGRSMSQPIVVGDRIFVGSATSDLMCMSKTDGKVLWIRSNTPWDALSTEDRAAYKDKIELLATELERLNGELVAAINSMVSPTGMDSGQQAQLDKKLHDRDEVEKKVHKAFEAIDRKRFPPLLGNEVSSSNATPCSDGRYIYWACGGGMKGTGASVISCFDPEGKRIWSYHEAFGAAEHGLHTSPLLVEGKLIYPACRWLMAFDAASGKVLWRQKTDEFCGNNIQAVRIGNENAVLSHHANLYRLSDGVTVAHADDGCFGDITPVVEKGVLYNPDKFKNWGSNNLGLVAFALPTSLAEKSKMPLLFELKHSDIYVPARGISYMVASPLMLDGILYSLDMSAGLSAVDVGARKSLYRRWLECYDRYDRYLYGMSASPTLGGKNIYIVDDAGYTILLRPGPEYKEVGRNVLENIHSSGIGGNPCRQESFYTAPYFDGRSLYLKGEEYLYCIREK